MAHPNATAAGASGGLSVVVLAVLEHFGISLDPLVAAAIASGAGSLVLLVGKDGVRGLVRRVWRGAGS